METLNPIPKWEVFYNKNYSSPSIAPEIKSPTVIPSVKTTANNNNLIVGVCIVLLVIGGVAVYYHIQLQKQKKELSDSQLRAN